ncbi:MAG: LPS export ABC transporter periplasmic protein LptC [Luteimonas sp.]
MSWRGALTIVLLIAAVLSGWSAWKQRRAALPLGAVAQRSDYVLHDFELIALDKQGAESFTLRAPKLERNPGDATMSMKLPVFLLPDKDGHYWNVRSNTGWVGADNKEVRLRGSVVATGPKEDQHEVWMNTEQLNVFPDANRATSDGLVTITQPGSTMTGHGMQVNLASKRFAFLSQVKHRYVPSH